MPIKTLTDLEEILISSHIGIYRKYDLALIEYFPPNKKKTLDKIRHTYGLTADDISNSHQSKQSVGEFYALIGSVKKDITDLHPNHVDASEVDPIMTDEDMRNSRAQLESKIMRRSLAAGATGTDIAMALKISDRKEKENKKAAENRYRIMSIEDLRKEVSSLSVEYGQHKLDNLLNNVRDASPDSIKVFKENIDELMTKPANVSLYHERMILGEYLTKLSNRGYWHYIPTGQSEKFIDSIGHGIPLSIYSAANGCGKTSAGIVSISNIIWENNPNYWRGDVFEKWGYNYESGFVEFPRLGWIITNRHSVENILELIKQYFPKDDYIMSKNGKDYFSHIVCRPGTPYEFVLNIMTYQQSPKQWESSTIGLVMLDEPSPGSLLRSIVFRLRKGGVGFITATDVRDAASAELYRYTQEIGAVDYEIYFNKKHGQELFATLIEGDMESACKQHGVRGHLEHREIVKMQKLSGKSEFEKRASGGLSSGDFYVFDKFSRDIHVIEPFAINDKDFTVYSSLDTHPDKKDYMIWVAIRHDGVGYIVHEWEFQWQSVYSFITEMNKIEKGWGIGQRYIELQAFSKDQHRGEGVGYQLEKAGYKFKKGSTLREDCEMSIKNAIDYKLVNGSFAGDGYPPKLYVFNTCPIAIEQIMNYHYLDATKSGKPVPNRTKDEAVETLGRILFTNPIHIKALAHQSKYIDDSVVYGGFYNSID